MKVKAFVQQFGAAIVLGVIAVGALALDMTFEEFIRYIATPGSLGAISSVVLAIVRRVWPEIDEDLAFVASVALAALAYVLASFVLPMLPELPAELELYWPAVVFLMQQIWYWLMKERVALYRCSTKKAQGA